MAECWQTSKDLFGPLLVLAFVVAVVAVAVADQNTQAAAH